MNLIDWMSIKNGTKWRCLDTRQYCHAKCETDGNIIEYIIKTKNDTDLIHNHAPDIVAFEHKEKRRIIKEATLACSKVLNNVRPRQILTNCVGTLNSKEAIATMPSYDADRQAINRCKKLNLPSCPQEPKTLSEINFPDFLTKCLCDDDQEKFLLYDSGKDDPDRFFIFSTLNDLKLLENSHCFADGTFSIAPKLFYQVYTIHAMS
ncbi:hypothetical protein BpHYR1_017343 [Brachionus plicatilis]|uniref:FLYWCH-type domain-containing protein n=1 Tax=Brachionus plicatilis TaxID=10195 RepID=A0A3M7R7B3_BRAPC|nr:hypothetical protein BpHYR1_017343 [Brachionus plicatilis]